MQELLGTALGTCRTFENTKTDPTNFKFRRNGYFFLVHTRSRNRESRTTRTAFVEPACAPLVD